MWAWRDGECIVVPRMGGRLPPQCCQTGSQPNVLRRRRLRWFRPPHRGLQAIFGMASWRVAEVEFYYEQTALRDLWWRYGLAWGCVGLGLVWWVLSARYLVFLELGLIGVFMSAGGTIGAMRVDRVHVTKMTEDHVWIAGLPASMREGLKDFGDAKASLRGGLSDSSLGN